MKYFKLIYAGFILTVFILLLPFIVNGQERDLSDLTVVIEFKSAPVSVNISHAPLKYNKNFALSYTLDDGAKETYTHAYKFLTGDVVDGTDYDPLYYTDGCGNNINFTMSSAIFSLSNDQTVDVHDPDNGYAELNITWPEIVEMYQGGWGIFNHGLTTASSGDIYYLIGRNHSYIKYKTQDATTGGINSSIFVNPNGEETFSSPAFYHGYNAAYRQYSYGVDYLNVYSTSTITDLDSLKMGRRELSGATSIAIIADDLNSAANASTFPWSSTFNHSVTGGNGYSFGVFKLYLQYIADTYGKDGLDNIWFTSEEDVLDYVIARDEITINQQIVGNKILLTFSGDVPVDLRNYALSLSVVSTGTDTISDITIEGDSYSTYSTLNKPEALINLEWDGADFPTALETATLYVDSAEYTQSQNLAYIAMDYVNILEASAEKEELRSRLCDIPGVTLPDGYCNCSTNIGNDTIICLDDCLELSVPEALSYLWSTGEETQSIIACPTSDSIFSIRVFNEMECEARDTIQIMVQGPPQVSLGNDTTLCLGECVVLSGGTGDNYLWNTDETTQSITVCPDITSQYILTITDALGCFQSDTIVVTVLEIVMPIISNDTAICFGECTNLIIIGGDSYLWSTGETNNTIEVCPVDTTTYDVVVTYTNGCVVNDSVTVNVKNNPLTTISNDTTVCMGDCIDLTISGGISYFWDTGETIQTINVCPIDTTEYYVTVINEYDCFTTDSVTVNVNSLPDLVTSTDTTICIGDCAVLRATGGDTYLWSTGASTANITVCPSETLTYYITATNLHDCSIIDSITVIVSEYPDANAGEDTTICRGDSATLTASGGSNFLWSTGEETQSIIVYPDDTKEYSVIVSNNTNCLAYDTVLVTVAPLPEVFAGNDTIVCPYTPVVLEAIGEGNFLWSTGETTALITIFPTELIELTVTITSTAGCQAVDEVVIDVYNAPNADAGADTIVCKGSYVELTATGGYVYEWDTGDSTNKIEVYVEDTSVYVVTVYNELGCFDTDYVVVYTYPIAEFSVGPDTTICLNDCVELIASGNIEEFLWLNTGENNDIIEVCPNQPTIYYLQATDENNCTYLDSVVVDLHPSAFVSLTEIMPVYCNNNNFLPQELWRRLHPVSKPKLFFMLAGI